MPVCEFDTGLAKRMVHLYADSAIEKTPIHVRRYMCHTDSHTNSVRRGLSRGAYIYTLFSPGLGLKRAGDSKVGSKFRKRSQAFCSFFKKGFYFNVRL